MARRKARLGPLLAPSTVLVVAGDEERGVWLWTVAPWVETLRGRMRDAEAAESPTELEEAMGHYARAVVESMRLAAEEGLVLDVHPTNFALVEDRIRYIDDDIGIGDQLPTLAYAILQRVEEYEDQPRALEGFLGQFEQLLKEEPVKSMARDLRLDEALASAVVRTDGASKARTRLLRHLAARG